MICKIKQILLNKLVNFFFFFFFFFFFGRCSPTQKADVVQLIRRYTGKQTCAIGDGGNDVSMIQAADVGVGIVGKEGKQASLASDFSITQFSFVCRLIIWHGRNSYKRSARLGQFVFHRGLVISITVIILDFFFFLRTNPNLFLVESRNDSIYSYSFYRPFFLSSLSFFSFFLSPPSSIFLSLSPVINFLSN